MLVAVPRKHCLFLKGLAANWVDSQNGKCLVGALGVWSPCALVGQDAALWACLCLLRQERLHGWLVRVRYGSDHKNWPKRAPSF